MAEATLQKLLGQSVLGMDCESNPAGKKAVYATPMDEIKGNCAVMQLAGADGADIVVIHFARFKTESDNVKELIPPTLEIIL